MGFLEVLESLTFSVFICDPFPSRPELFHKRCLFEFDTRAHNLTQCDLQLIVFIGWLGRRGIAPVLYLLMAVAALGVDGYGQVMSVIELTITIGVCAHGKQYDATQRVVRVGARPAIHWVKAALAVHHFLSIHFSSYQGSIPFSSKSICMAW